VSFTVHSGHGYHGAHLYYSFACSVPKQKRITTTYGAPRVPLRPTDSDSASAHIRSSFETRVASPPALGSAAIAAGIVGLQQYMHSAVFLVSGIASQNAPQNRSTFAKQNKLCIAKLCQSIVFYVQTTAKHTAFEKH